MPTFVFCNHDQGALLCGRERGHDGSHGVWTQPNGRPPHQESIEVCHRCLRVLRGNARIDLDWLCGEWVWCCANLDVCKRRQKQNRRDHRNEIGERLFRGRGHHTHLIVVLDKFGAIYGYGNYYVAVEPGQSPERIADLYRRSPSLIIESILEIDPE